MQSFQRRVVIEQMELDEKLDKLLAFMQTDAFGYLDDDERSRLRRQYSAMQDYSRILAERIANFK
jgi:hypothetical protein